MWKNFQGFFIIDKIQFMNIWKKPNSRIYFLAELSDSLLSFKCFLICPVTLTQKKCFKVFTEEKYALLTSLAHYTVYRFAYFYNIFYNVHHEYFEKSLFNNLEFRRFCWNIFKDFVSLIILDLWIFGKILFHEFTFLAELSDSLLSFKCFFL